MVDSGDLTFAKTWVLNFSFRPNIDLKPKSKKPKSKLSLKLVLKLGLKQNFSAKT